MAVISEFGEELKSFQEELVNIIKKVVENLQKGAANPTKVLPGDIPFIYNIWDESVYCILSHSMIPVNEINYCLPNENNGRFYYYSEIEDDSSIAKMGSRAEDFERQREERKELYFK